MNSPPINGLHKKDKTPAPIFVPPGKNTAKETMGNKKVALIILFNHQYNKNIPTLRKIYANRFSNVFFLVPFYEGTEKDIIPVFENSYYFQGYLAQGFRQFYQEDFEQYLVVADDMILNPAMNEHNYTDFFGISNSDNYLPQVFNLHNLENSHTFSFDEFKLWGKTLIRWHNTRSILKFNLKKLGVECSRMLPSIEEATLKLAKQGYTVQPLSLTDVADNIKWKDNPLRIAKRSLRMLQKMHLWFKKIEMPYPVVGGYSDMVIINKATIQKFVQYCGAFAALDLWVEMALPTALLLASDTQVVTEVETGKRGILYWPRTDEAVRKHNNDMEAYQYKLSHLSKNFPKDKLYIHPVKLSKWVDDLNTI